MPARTRLRSSGTAIAKASAPRLQSAPKEADKHYLSPEHKAWRAEVLRRAGYRCEWVDEQGHRCTAGQEARLIGDHVRERKDGGADLDPANGMCLCSAHHNLKTARERAKRLGPGR